MPLADRNIIITPNRGASSEPTIRFTGADASSSATITLRVLNSGTVGTLSFEGTAGQLFSVSDNFAGSIFSVNDVSGIPSIEVLDTGEIRLAQYSGFVDVLSPTNATSTNSGAFQVVGGAGIGRDLYVGGTIYGTISGTLTGNAATVSAIQRTTSADHFLTFVDSNNASSTAEIIYTTSSFTINPSSGNVTMTASSSGTDGLYVYNGGQYVTIRSRMTAGANNNIVQAGDTGIIFTNGSIGTGNFVLAPWNGTTGGLGLRMDANGGTTVRGSLDVRLSPATAFFRVAGAASSSSNVVIQSNDTGGTAFWLTAKTNGTLHLGGNGGSEPASGAIVIEGSTNNIGIGTNTPGTRLDVSGGLRVSGITTITNATAATSALTGALQVSGGVGISGDLYTGLSGNFQGLIVQNTQIYRPNGQVQIIGGGTASSRNSVILSNNFGAVIYGGSAATNAPASSAFGIILAGGDGNVSVPNTTASTSTTTGALQVVGGVGIGGNLYVGGEIVAQRLTIQFTTVTTTLIQTDDVIQTLNVTNATSTITGALQVAGGAGIGRDLYVGGTIYGNISGTVTGSASQVNTIQRTTNANHVLTFVDSNNASSTGELLYTTSSFVINPSTSNVGIGVTSPSYKLDIGAGTLGSTSGDQVIAQRITVSSSNADYLEISNLRTAAGSDWTTAGWRLQQKVDATWMGYIQFNGSTNNGGIAFGSGTTTTSPNTIAERVRINSSGNVGVGTATPQYRLDVNNSSGSSFQASFGSTISSGSISGIHFGYSEAANQLYRKSAIVFERSDTSFGDARGKVHILNGPQSGSGSATLADSKLTIASDGFVGIGTTVPNALLQLGTSSGVTELLRLHVSYDTSRSDRGGIRWSDSTNITGRIATEYDGTMVSMVFGSLYNSGYNSNNLMAIRGNGNVGIGTTTPGHNLDIIDSSVNTYSAGSYNSGATLALRAAGTSTNDYSGIRFTNSNGSREAFFGVVQGSASNIGDFVFQTYNGTTTTYGERVRITHEGNFLVGQTTFQNAGVSGGVTVASPSFVVGGQTSSGDSMYLRRFGSSLYQLQTYNAGNTGFLQLQPYGGNVMIGGSGSTSTNAFEVQGSNGQLFSVNDSFTGTIFAASDISGIPSIEVLDTGLVKLAQYNGQVAISTATIQTGMGLTVYTATYITSLGVGTVASGTFGEIRAANEITAYYSSDRRLKENISIISNPIEIIQQIRGVRFDWTDEYIKKRGGEDGYFVRKNDIGVIAQEVEAVLPEVVATREDGFKAVKYEKLVSLLIEAVKEQQHNIDLLKEELTNLKQLIKRQ